ncbi:uncharacterized protein PGTG_19105 [Puccinia graminis f. sp. tritici CRL 75-36-700-3]|uniref:Uncharacterized protein n=1 Tax=Puccinia graminis f. sp. tritici (strain CRL 75-36-700-3 / race SCCL) TaxID=418459 RepID=E3L9X7_PUCGT|nr:uncharacterized protein PGTG_19105 [Puccinia graminis f. sp. tritici CRL 75-36-700-3]EFP93372.1 hypothetical protein PGTG_19105 [Puccinia graminis f. sp. tritici CRL 75-36-700-3]
MGLSSPTCGLGALRLLSGLRTKTAMTNKLKMGLRLKPEAFILKSSEATKVARSALQHPNDSSTQLILDHITNSGEHLPKFYACWAKLLRQLGLYSWTMAEEVSDKLATLDISPNLPPELAIACTRVQQFLSVLLPFIIDLAYEQRAFSGKSGQKTLKTTEELRSGPFFAAHTRSVSGVVAEFRYATLIANSNSAALRYTNRYA